MRWLTSGRYLQGFASILAHFFQFLECGGYSLCFFSAAVYISFSRLLNEIISLKFVNNLMKN